MIEISIFDDENRLESAAHNIFSTSLIQMNRADGERAAVTLTGQYNSGYIDDAELEAALESKSTYELLGMADYFHEEGQ